MGNNQTPVKFILCTGEQIQKMNSKSSLSLAEDQKEQLENSIEEQEEKSTMGSQEQIENSI